MSKFEGTVSLELDVTVPLKATNRSDATDELENMSLSEFLEWSGCASFNMNILEINSDE